jgi:hypothetical protein
VNTADAFNLATGALTKTVRYLDEYDADPDASIEDLLDDIRAIGEDTLTHLRDAGYVKGVAAMREP